MEAPLKLDLHTHTCLSPCGDARMIPQRILQSAADRNIDVIGITDHNSMENVAAVKKAAHSFEIAVLGGMEVTSQEEAHILAFFDEIEVLEDFQELIYSNLHGANSPEAFGYQWVVDSEGNVEDVNPRLLIGATALPIHSVVDAIHGRNGIAIAAHVDRTAYSVISQLGFIPCDLDLDAIELSPFYEETGSINGSRNLPTVTFSDAHFLEDVGRTYTQSFLRKVSVEELKNAVRGEKGRWVRSR